MKQNDPPLGALGAADILGYHEATENDGAIQKPKLTRDEARRLILRELELDRLDLMMRGVL